MSYLLVRHKVSDFTQWKTVFDSHDEAQQQAGIKIEKIIQNMDDPNEVFLFFQVTDLEKARGFVASPEVPEAQQQSGLVDSPDIYFLD